MSSGRPKLKVPYQQVDIIIELVNITLLLMIWGYTIMHFSDLPDTIATHFSANGKADGFGSKATIWLLPSIALVMYIGLFVVAKFPHVHNYFINITEENALKNYRLSSRIVRFANLYCLLLFAVITYELIDSAQGLNTNILGIPFLIFTLGIPVVGIVYAFYYQKKINK